jgi:uncharacterized protein (TIRG00374 family)
LNDIWIAIKSSDLTLLFIAFVLTFVGYVIGTLRWRTLLNALDIDIPFWYLIRSYLVGIFFSNFLPSTVGGDAMRIYDSYKYSQQRAAPTAVVLVGRILGVFSLILFASIAVLFFKEIDGRIVTLRWIVFGGMVTLCTLIGLLFFGKQRSAPKRTEENKTPNVLARVMGKVIRGATIFRGQNRALLIATGYSILLQGNVVIHYFLVAKSVGITVGFFNFFLIIPLSVLVTMLPVTINGIGIRETANILFLGVYGVTEPTAIAFTWIGFGILLLNVIIGGFVYLLRR